MATIHLKFRPSTIEGKEGTLFYQVIHRRCIRQLKTPYAIYPSEWDETLCLPRASQATPSRKEQLQLICEQTAHEINRIKTLAQQWERQGMTFTADQLISEFASRPSSQTVFSFMQSLIAAKKEKGQLCSARNFSTALHRLQEFRQGADLTFASLDSNLMERFERWLQSSKGLRRNTTSSYFRSLRTVYLAAVEAGFDTHRTPFAHVYTGIDTTTKRALTKRDLQAIRTLNLTSLPHLSLARDLFILSFYLRGMPFVDMAYLRKTDLHEGFVHYCRRKTHKPIEVKWENEMQEIVDRHAHLTKGSPFLLPIITSANGNERQQYERAMGRQNRNLKFIGRMAGIAAPLTQYAARHSWASLAYDSNVPMAVISRGMGHSNEQVTLTYIKSLDTSAVDRASHRLIKL